MNSSMTSTFPSQYPALSYSAAMKCSFSLPEQGERRIVGTCSARDFSRFIDSCLSMYQPANKATREAFQACSTELTGLDYGELLSRWFALNLLHDYKIPVVLADEDAQASGSEQVL